jgi:putative SbcD/Mre11-related phosphoesterase
MLNLLLPYPAAIVKSGKTRTLLIADPHLGWERPLQEKGIHIPSQTDKILSKLIAIICENKPDKLVIIGDVKYTVVSHEFSEWQDIPEFFRKLQDVVGSIVIVKGNHDSNLEPLLPENVAILPATGTVIGDVGVFHGHKWPSPALLGCKTLVMGHLHPTVVFRDPAGFKMTRQVWLKARIDGKALARVLLQKSGVKLKGSLPADVLQEKYDVKLKTSELYVIPSFNDFLGGKAVNETRPRIEVGSEALIGPVLRSNSVDVDESELYLLDGTYLGTLNQLRLL